MTGVHKCFNSIITNTNWAHCLRLLVLRLLVLFSCKFVFKVFKVIPSTEYASWYFQTLSAYLKFMIDLGELLGGDRNETEEQMYKVIEFEQRIANVRNNSDKASSRNVWNLIRNQTLFVDYIIRILRRLKFIKYERFEQIDSKIWNIAQGDWMYGRTLQMKKIHWLSLWKHNIYRKNIK